MTRRAHHLPVAIVACAAIVLAVAATIFGWPTALLALWVGATATGLAFLIRVALFERVVLPVRDGMRQGERDALRRRGRCAGCGYDLRATPERCPECGEVAETEARTPSPARH